MNRTDIVEAVQQMVVRILATRPAGIGLCLIGGFRYRWLDGSGRRSVDVDYHFDGDLEAKQREIGAVLARHAPAEVRRTLNLDCQVAPAGGPEGESDVVKTVVVAVFKAGSGVGRIEVPVDITRIPCLDRPRVRTVDGVVYLSASDADAIESKILALFTRVFVQARDILDIFLFASHLPPDAADRLEAKIRSLGLTKTELQDGWAGLLRNRDAHLRGLAQVMDEQLDAGQAERLRQAGGPPVVFDGCRDVVRRALRLEPGR